MKGIYSQDVIIPRLRDLTLCIVNNVCPGLPPLSLPSLQNLTFSLQYKCFLTTEWTVPEGDLHRIFTTVLAAYGPQLRRLHLNPVDWDEGWRDLVIHNQLLLDHCPALEHFITYTINPAARASHHPTLRWIDIWISFEDNEYDSDVYDDATATCVQDDATAVCVQDAEKFPALQGCRFLNLSLSPISDLPVLASPEDTLPDDGSGVRWTIPPFRICQTYDMVTWEDFFEYDSDSDSSFKLSPSEEDDDLMDSETDSDSEEFSDDDDTIPEPTRLLDTEPGFDIDRLAAGIVY
ncbi:hypothetical protein EWM64_g9268 [Hericium alpestre]|uniref:F-box domain-containing protein n=1 Tax=Hericium alpestre TaxID=135208 RepID=A0A4Y9ZJW4_9AGAM|nr:hypothetical protein EWM64_g9268 [Hericium alpestre]